MHNTEPGASTALLVLSFTDVPYQCGSISPNSGLISSRLFCSHRENDQASKCIFDKISREGKGTALDLIDQKVLEEAETEQKRAELFNSRKSEP